MPDLQASCQIQDCHQAAAILSDYAVRQFLDIPVLYLGTPTNPNFAILALLCN